MLVGFIGRSTVHPDGITCGRTGSTPPDRPTRVFYDEFTLTGPRQSAACSTRSVSIPKTDGKTPMKRPADGLSSDWVVRCRAYSEQPKDLRNVTEGLEDLDDAWLSFSERIKAVGESITGDGFPEDPRLRAEGYRYVSRLTNLAFQIYVEFGDPAWPSLFRVGDDTTPFGATNTDNNYYRSMVDPAGEYRVSGDVEGGAVHLPLCPAHDRPDTESASPGRSAGAFPAPQLKPRVSTGGSTRADRRPPTGCCPSLSTLRRGGPRRRHHQESIRAFAATLGYGHRAWRASTADAGRHPVSQPRSCR